MNRTVWRGRELVDLTYNWLLSAISVGRAL
jgi:hypothetical protein